MINAWAIRYACCCVTSGIEVGQDIFHKKQPYNLKENIRNRQHMNEFNVEEKIYG